MKIIIGITGLIGAGKDTAANYLSDKLSAPVFSISAPLVEMTKKKFGEVTRENLVRLGAEVGKRFGDDYLAQEALKKVKNRAIITGIRQIGQVEYFESNSTFLLIAISAKANIRFKRKNQESHYLEAKTLDQFNKNERQENSGSQPQRVLKCMKVAKYEVSNNGSLQCLFYKLDKLIKLEKEFFKVDL